MTVLLNCVSRSSKSRPAAPGPRPAARLSVETLDDRIVPATLSVGDTTVLEGNVGTNIAAVVVTLSEPTSKTVSVNYATADGTARAGTEYQAASGKLTFAPGETSKTIQVRVIGDRVHEPDKAFVVNLSGAQRAKVADARGIVTVLDDEPRISIGDAYNYGEPTFTFTVVLAFPSDEVVTVNFATMDGSAIGGVDYVAASGTLTFAPGETTNTITVDVIPLAASWDKSFYVQLTAPSANAVLSDGQAVGLWSDLAGYSGYVGGGPYDDGYPYGWSGW
jgi:large repetitive protein